MIFSRVAEMFIMNTSSGSFISLFVIMMAPA